MTQISDDQRKQLSLVAYEKLTSHGFALPLYKSSASANALHVAVPSRVGDPEAVIVGFEVYEAEDVITLGVDSQRSAVGRGAAWLDVFLWSGVAHVGTRSEIWESISDKRREIEQLAPLSLLAVADGARAPSIGDIAATAYTWLARSWCDAFAVRWQVETYLRGLFLRDMRRQLDATSAQEMFETTIRSVPLVLVSKTIELRLPVQLRRKVPINAGDLPDFVAASLAFGLNVSIMPPEGKVDDSLVHPRLPSVLLMRIRKGRGGTQTQIPFGAIDEYFHKNLKVRDATSGQVRSMTMSKADGRRNTMKLQLPEMIDLVDPVIRFERTADTLTYSLHDASSREGAVIVSSLEEGLLDGSTRRTQGKATWWRLLP
jgi:hypothetical protein